MSQNSGAVGSLPAPTATTTAASLPAASQPTTGSGPAADDPFAPLIRPAPANAQQTLERREILRTRLAEVLHAHPTASAPETQPDSGIERSPGQRLYAALSLYESELNRWQATSEQIQELRTDTHLEARAQEISQWQEQRKHYAALAGEHLRYAPPAHLEEIENESTRWEALLTDLTGQQSAREQQLASVRRVRAEIDASIAQSLDRVRSFVAELAARLETVQSTAERDALLTTKRALEWEHNLQLLRAAALTTSRTLLELQQEQDIERVAALADYVETLQGYRSRLQQARSQSLTEFASEQVKRADLPDWRRTYWQMVLIAAEGKRYFQELELPTRSRFSASAHDRLEARITRARAYWDDFMESMERRPGPAILSAYHRAGERLAHERKLLRQLRRQLDATIDEQRSATDRQGQLLDELEPIRARFDEEIRPLEGDALAEARRLQAQLTSEVRAELEESIQVVTSEQQALRERLKKGVATLDEHVRALSRYRSRMYWSHLLVPSHSLAPTSWAAAGTELRELLAGQANRREAWRLHASSVQEEWHAMSFTPWAAAFLVLVGSVAGGCRTRRWWVPEPAIADGPVAASWSFPQRLRYEARLLGASLAPWLLPLIAGVLFLGVVIGWRSASFATLGTAMISVLMLTLALGLVHANFNASRPRSRLVRCPDRVARYHRRWLTTLAWLSFVTLPVVAFLAWTELLPHTLLLLRAAGATLLLVVCCLYLLQARMFVGDLDNVSPDRQGLSRLTRLFPLLPAFAAGLVLLQLAGYDALTRYVAAGLFVTVLVTWTAVSLWLPLQARTREAEQKLDQALTAGESVDLALDPRTIHPMLLIAVQVLKVAILVGAAVAILAGWGISPLEIGLLLDYPLVSIGEQPVRLWRLVASTFAAAAGFLVSRGARAFLQTQVFPRSRISRSAQAASCTLLHYSLVGLGIYTALVLLNLRLGALAVLLGTLGLGLGLGLQPVLVNFISGLLILFERQIKVGDIIEVGDQLGEVTAVSIRSTKIRTFDNVELDIPNGEFVTSKVVNWTMPDSKIRGKVTVGVSYDSDEQLVRRLLLEVARSHPLVLRDPPPAVWFHNFGESSLDFTLACWFATPAHRGEFLMQCRFEIRRLFREHQVEMPFPQRTLSLAGGKPIPIELVTRDGSPPAQAPPTTPTPPPDAG